MPSVTLDTNNALIYMLLVIALGLGSWTLKSITDQNIMIAQMQSHIQQTQKEIVEIKTDKDGYIKQWEVISNLKDRIIKLETMFSQ